MTTETAKLDRNDPSENAYMIIVGKDQLTQKHALDMFKAGVAAGKSGEVVLDFKNPVREFFANHAPKFNSEYTPKLQGEGEEDKLAKFKKILDETPEHIKKLVSLTMDNQELTAELQSLKLSHGKLVEFLELFIDILKIQDDCERESALNNRAITVTEYLSSITQEDKTEGI